VVRFSRSLASSDLGFFRNVFPYRGIEKYSSLASLIVGDWLRKNLFERARTIILWTFSGYLGAKTAMRFLRLSRLRKRVDDN
jgi:hypothetical protein